jgi:hypothetical protein
MSGFNPNYANSNDYTALLKQLINRLSVLEKDNNDLKIKCNDLEKQLKVQVEFIKLEILIIENNFLVFEKIGILKPESKI